VCGIAGMVGAPDARLLRAMARIMAHRGPDDEGVWHDADAGLAARRLKIIDLVGGHQPMPNEDASGWLAFNGEIYNYRELRARLEAKGHRFRSRSDGETILHLYEDEGDGCLEHLEGMFAFALWDRARRRLLLARDPLGVKPLYYREQGDRLAFASEAKALLLDPTCPREPDLPALAAYLAFLYVPSPATAFAGVRKLAPGHKLVFENGRGRVEAYWRPQAPERPITEPAEAAERVLAALDQSVSRHLVSDVPLGVFLSSGLDSSSIATLMRRVAPGAPIRTFTLDFEEASFGEAAAARAVARAVGSEHLEFVVRPAVADVLPALAWHLDEPLADSSLVLTHLIARLAREHVTVALSGIGGDELFIGYPRYLGARAAARYAGLVPVAVRRRLARAAGRLPDSARSDDPTGRLRRFLEAGPLDPADRYLAWVSFWNTAALRELLPSLTPEIDPFVAHRAILHGALANGSAGARAATAVAALDLLTYLPDDLLMLGDKMTMAASLELRVPFCDRRLVDTIWSVDPALRGGRGLKPLLRRVMGPLLPPAILRRPKRGFSVPLGSWLRGPLAAMAADLLSETRLRRRGLLAPAAVRRLVDEHRAGRRNHADRLFALMVLELWQEAFWDEWPGRRRALFAEIERAPGEAAT
jgi:asparagine synthase (glutamine-hydrolysing)